MSYKVFPLVCISYTIFFLLFTIGLNGPKIILTFEEDLGIEGT